MLVVASWLLVPTSAGLALNALAGAHASLAVIYVVTAIAARLSGVVSTVTTAAVPLLLEARDQLTPAYATMQVINQVGLVVGPAVSGLVIAVVGLLDLCATVFGLPRALFPALTHSVYHGGPATLGLLYATPAAGGGTLPRREAPSLELAWPRAAVTARNSPGTVARAVRFR